MAKHASAVKARRQSEKRREANRQLRSRLRGALRSIRTAIDEGEAAEANAAIRDTVSLIDRMAGKKIIHANTAARYKSRLMKRLAQKSSAA